MISIWARAAISGTTPPNAACSAIWLMISFDKISPGPPGSGLDDGGGGFVASGFNTENAHDTPSKGFPC